jgi:hypothetical protein
MAGITEGNPLAPHYVCPECKHFEWYEGEEKYDTGYDMPEKACPKCGARLKKEGHTKIMSYTYAKDMVSAPGESDMQTGLCIVLKGKEESFRNSDACRWLENNMGKYGFVFRYPEGKQTATGEEATKLVLRYVGPETAVVMRRLSMCLEEYVHYLN